MTTPTCKQPSSDTRLATILYRSLERLSLAIEGCAKIGFQESRPTTNAHHASIWNDLNEAQKDAKLKLKFLQGPSAAGSSSQPSGTCESTSDRLEESNSRVPGKQPSKEAQPCHASNEPIEVKLIAAASDGYVNVTPEKCERLRRLLDSERAKARLEEARYFEQYIHNGHTRDCTFDNATGDEGDYCSCGMANRRKLVRSRIRALEQAADRKAK